MATFGQFVDALKQTDNFSGTYAIELIEEAAPKERWEVTLAQELTPGMAEALFDAVKARLEEVRGHYETDEGLGLVDEEINSYISFFGSVAVQHSIEFPDSISRQA